ncbi:MAG: 16S rRNA (guanine(966)-N(2))-methyltransferase RsmD [Kangiellaceae bacterium]|nr:16S rRNA (guanine(966)-N(2))-methyltransferase RsmD [Kangiellaceae bacterium]
MSQKKSQKKNKRSNTNTLRIIGGDWRSRKLSFIDAQGLRPTPDRIRETLFNWLQGYVHGAKCLDLFAGSGILGLEALSRGAARVDFVEMNKAVAQQLESNLDLLSSSSKVYHQDALDYLQAYLLKYKSEEKVGGGKSYDLILLDPPYRKNLLEKTLQIICDKENNLINENTLFYVEHESEEIFDWEEYGLKELKEAKAGQVKRYLMGW